MCAAGCPWWCSDLVDSRVPGIGWDSGHCVRMARDPPCHATSTSLRWGRARNLEEKVGPYVIIGYGGANLPSTFKGLPHTPTNFALTQLKANAEKQRILRDRGVDFHLHQRKLGGHGRRALEGGSLHLHSR